MFEYVEGDKMHILTHDMKQIIVFHKTFKKFLKIQVMCLILIVDS